MIILRYIYYSILFVHKIWDRLMSYLFLVDLRKRSTRCGKNVYIYYPMRISGLEMLDVGDNVHINRGAYIRAEGGLRIGDNVHMGPNLVIYTLNHKYDGDALPYDINFVYKPVVIEKNVWIGANVTIVPGATIGEGAIVGAGAVVSGQVPPLAIVANDPAKIIKYRDRMRYAHFENLGRYGGVQGKLYTQD